MRHTSNVFVWTSKHYGFGWRLLTVQSSEITFLEQGWHRWPEGGSWSSGSPVLQLCRWTACNPATGCTGGTRQGEEVGGLELKSQRRPAFHGGKDLAFRKDLANSLPFQLHFLFSFYLRSVFPINSDWETKARSQWCLRNAKEQTDPGKQMPARDPTAKRQTLWAALLLPWGLWGVCAGLRIGTICRFLGRTEQTSEAWRLDYVTLEDCCFQRGNKWNELICLSESCH